MTTAIYDERFKCAYDKLVDIDVLQPNPKNPNKHPDRQIEMLAKIIKYQGQRAPIVVSNRSGFITKGHGRLMALKKLGFDKAAVDYQDYEDEAQEYADMVADNKIAELAEHDDKFMNDIILAEFPDIDLELLGLDDFKLEMPFEGKTDEDAVPDDVPARAKLGDIYQLGNHRLMCGDSTDKDTVEMLMNGEKADMVFTDPPYGMNLNVNYDEMFKKDSGHKATGERFTKIIGDDNPYDPSHLMSLAEEVFLWGADYFYDNLPAGGSWSAWDKRNETMDAVIGNTTEFLWSKIPHRRMTARVLWSGHHGMGKNDEKKRVHPTQKPIALVEWFFSNYAKNCLSIIDLFGGSGSTLIACEKTNRKCFMMELDPHYVDVIIKRWEDYTGRKAELISSLDKTKPIHDTLIQAEF